MTHPLQAASAFEPFPGPTVTSAVSCYLAHLSHGYVTHWQGYVTHLAHGYVIQQGGQWNLAHLARRGQIGRWCLLLTSMHGPSY
jgi:hypothetical protein